MRDVAVEQFFVQAQVYRVEVILGAAVDKDRQLSRLQFRRGILRGKARHFPAAVVERNGPPELSHHRILFPPLRIVAVGAEALFDVPVFREGAQLHTAAHRPAGPEGLRVPQREVQRAVSAHAVTGDRPSPASVPGAVKAVDRRDQLFRDIGFITHRRSVGLSQYQLL